MNNFLQKIIGDKEQYTLQHRILNASMLLAVILNVVASISNYMLGLHWSAIAVGTLGIITFLFLYFYSFYARKYKIVVIIGLGFLICLFIPSVWFTNGGSIGSTQYLIFLVLTGVLTISKGKTRIILVVLLVFVTLFLLLFEYYYPEVMVAYPNRKDNFLDLAISFIFTVLGATFYINIYYQEYHAANKELKEKNIILEKKQKEITIQQNKIENQKAELEKKATALQEAIKTKDRFFSIIAHDLKSPFNALIGFSELIEQAAEDKDIDGIKEFNKYVLQSSTQTHKLLLNLLEWSKAQTNQTQYSPEKIEINKIINEHVRSFEYQANKKNIILKANPMSCTVYADINMINTVLRNLISNAIKFTPKEGMVEIGVKTRHALSLTEIYVKDNGVGISEENLKKMFDLGENTSTRGTDGEKGSGLGLVLCKELIEKNQGELFVESTLNKGSVFSFSLPLFDNQSSD